MTHEEHASLESAFIDGFREARDKPAFLRLARIPLELEAPGRAGLKLMQVVIEDAYEVGRASPGFGTRELVYHPVPVSRVSGIAQLRFRYVSADELRELTLAEVMTDHPAASPSVDAHHHHHATDAGHSHDQHHPHSHPHRH